MNRNINYQEDDVLQKDDGQIDIFYLAKLSIVARIFLLRCLLIGIALGLIVALILPWKFVSRFEIKVSGLAAMTPVVLDIFNQRQEIKDGNFNETRNLINQFVFAALSRSINNKEVFDDAYLASTGNINSENLHKKFESVVNFSALSTIRGQEGSFSPGYSVEVTLDSELEAKNFAYIYLESIDHAATNAIKVSLNDQNDANRSLNNMRLSVAKEQFRLSSQIQTKKLEASIGISEIGNIEKPLIQLGSTISSQIPIIDAVPQYFFGFQILRKEKDNVEENAKMDLMIPGFDKFMAADYQFVAQSKILPATKIHLFDSVVSSKTIIKNGWLMRLSVIFIFSFFFVTLGFLRVYFQDLLRVREAAKSYTPNL